MFNNKRIKKLEQNVADLEAELIELDMKIDRQAFIVIDPKMYHQSLDYCGNYMTKETRVSIEYVLRYILKELGLKLEYKCKPGVTTYIKKKNKKGGK